MEGRTYRYMRNDKPLFPFGYGLSYTQFEIGKAQLSASTVAAGKPATITIPVANVGKKDGTEVVQVYVRNPQDPNGPIKQLRGYQRVSVKAGTTASASIELSQRSFEWFDEETNTVRTKAGKYEVLYGTSSDAADLQSVMIDVQE